jgi:quinolinate synthase
MLCPNMKLTTLAKVRDCLAQMTGEVIVDPQVSERALLAVERMVAIG